MLLFCCCRSICLHYCLTSLDKERSSVPALVCGWTTKRFLHAERDELQARSTETACWRPNSAAAAVHNGHGDDDDEAKLLPPSSELSRLRFGVRTNVPSSRFCVSRSPPKSAILRPQVPGQRSSVLPLLCCRSHTPLSEAKTGRSTDRDVEQSYNLQ